MAAAKKKTSPMAHRIGQSLIRPRRHLLQANIYNRMHGLSTIIAINELAAERFIAAAKKQAA